MKNLHVDTRSDLGYSFDIVKECKLEERTFSPPMALTRSPAFHAIDDQMSSAQMDDVSFFPSNSNRCSSSVGSRRILTNPALAATPSGMCYFTRAGMAHAILPELDQVAIENFFTAVQSPEAQPLHMMLPAVNPSSSPVPSWEWSRHASRPQAMMSDMQFAPPSDVAEFIPLDMMLDDPSAIIDSFFGSGDDFSHFDSFSIGNFGPGNGPSEGCGRSRSL